MQVTNTPRWINLVEAAALLQVPLSRLRIYAKNGSIGTRDLPGVRAKYSLADVERLAAESNKTAAK